MQHDHISLVSGGTDKIASEQTMYITLKLRQKEI